MAADPTTRFAALLRLPDADLPLDEALLLIAAHARPDLDLEAERARLDALAERLSAPTVGALRALLVDDLGFAGDRATYYDARNSLLPDVLDRRLGIPLSLAQVAIEVGRRAGVALEGVGLPGHYLLRPAGDPSRHLDLFHEGRWLDPAGVRALFEQVQPGVPWDERWLQAVDGPRPMLARTLANLAAAHRRSGDREALAWALELRLLLPGATPLERRELGLLLGAAGRFAAGAAVLEESDDESDHLAAARLRARLN